MPRLIEWPCSWFAKHAGDPSRLLGGQWRDEKQAAVSIDRLNKANFHTYFHINKSAHALPILKGRREDVVEWSKVLFDFDSTDGRPVEGVDAIGRRLVEAVNVFLPGSGKCCSVTFSGRGMQLFLHVEPVALPPEYGGKAGKGNLCGWIERASKQLLGSFARLYGTHEGLKCDDCTYDIARVARLPRSNNPKSGRTCAIIYEATEEYNPQAILNLVPATKPVDEWRTVADVVDDNRVDNAFLLARCSNLAVTFLTEGVDSPGRHHAAFASALSLRDAGVSELRAVDLVTRGGGRSRPEMDRRACKRAVRCAYGREIE